MDKFTLGNIIKVMNNKYIYVKKYNNSYGIY